MNTVNESSASTLRILKALHTLTLQAMLAQSKAELEFRILNDSIKLLPYTRAILCEINDNCPEIIGISGQSEVNRQAPYVEACSKIVKNISNPDKAQIIPASPELPVNAQQVFVAWVPLFHGSKVKCGLWLERSASWNEEELPLLDTLAQGYAVALARFQKWRRFKEFCALRRNKIIALVAAMIILLFPVRLRVVARCEVVASNPFLVTAPLDGTIESIDIQPGQEVSEKDILFRYDVTPFRDEHRIALQKVHIAKSQKEQAEAEAYNDDKSKSMLFTLGHRLAQEMIREQVAKEKFSKATVIAPRKGRILIEQPDEWEGRAVRKGDPVMTIVDPNSSRLRIYIPQGDNIEFNNNIPVVVFLNVDPGTHRQASLGYISSGVRLDNSGVPSFFAQADWLKDQDNPKKLGLEGTAFIYGKRVSLLYWLLRRPLATFRSFVGF